ncbi:MAG: ABC transporter permease [Archangiaceae bacterium]|nr:ABC transporter permease [Archangiaceae bacterium]
MTFLIAFRSLLQHKRRTFVLGAAVAFVTVVMLTLLGIAEGMNRTLIESSTTLMSGHVNVAGFYKVTAGQAAPVVTHYKQVVEVIRQAVPELKYIAQRGRGWAKITSDGGTNKMFGLTGIDVKNEKGLAAVLKIKEGKLEDLAKPGSIMLFEDQARDLEVKVGDALTIQAPTPRGVNNTLDVTVVAIANNMGMMSQFSSFINEASLRQLYQLNDETTGALMIYMGTTDLVQLKKVEDKLREALGKSGYQILEEDPRAFFFKFENVTREAWTGQKLDITNWRDEVNFVSWTVDLMNALAFFLAFVFLSVVGIGIMIVMWISIRERTREIGTLRAIGMQRGRVMRMFLAEGFLLGVLSTTAGALFGLVLAVVINGADVTLPQGFQFILMSDHLKVVPTVAWTLVAVVFITAVITGISLLPSFIAARLKPVTAMQHVG